MTPAVETVELRRTFGDTVAVDGLSIRIETGEVFGVLGPNGAGKTTTIKMLTTLLKPTSGTARIFGFDVTTQGDEVRRRVGYVTQELFMRYMLTGREALEIDAALYHVPRTSVRPRVEEALRFVGLAERGDQLVQQYSGGMKKRLDIAAVLLHEPALLVLDEPTLGLDVQARHTVWEQIELLRDEGVTVLIATNNLEEADRLCGRLMIIDHGREVVSGAPAELKRAVGADVIDVEADSSRAVEAAFTAEPWVRQVAVTNGVAHLYVDDAAAGLPIVMRGCVDHGIELRRVGYSTPSLDDVFLLHTGRELRDEGGGAGPRSSMAS